MDTTKQVPTTADQIVAMINECLQGGAPYEAEHTCERVLGEWGLIEISAGDSDGSTPVTVTIYFRGIDQNVVQELDKDGVWSVRTVVGNKAERVKALDAYTLTMHSSGWEAYLRAHFRLEKRVGGYNYQLYRVK